MRACSLVCMIGLVFLLIDQCYSGVNWGRLFIGGFVAVALWSDCERWLRYRLKRRKRMIPGLFR